mmetsp:Transcript_47265/g.78249  ORF Transcript_47265/g.78249 Transcript_47265/m.78249 type:complete len:123 (-) Transcript_47265:1069-1437(-)
MTLAMVSAGVLSQCFLTALNHAFVNRAVFSATTALLLARGLVDHALQLRLCRRLLRRLLYEVALTTFFLVFLTSQLHRRESLRLSDTLHKQEYLILRSFEFRQLRAEHQLDPLVDFDVILRH